MIEDKEWEEAKNADESELYFKCTKDNGSYAIRRYKPSQARLVSRRTGWHLTPVDTLIC